MELKTNNETKYQEMAKPQRKFWFFTGIRHEESLSPLVYNW